MAGTSTECKLNLTAKDEIMFIRFSKGDFNEERKRLYRKCVFIGGSLVMEYGDSIVGIARLHEETQNCLDYDVVVAKNCNLGGATIERYIKDMIGKSNKFSETPSTKRRKYYVEEVECESLPIKAEITFSKETTIH